MPKHRLLSQIIHTRYLNSIIFCLIGTLIFLFKMRDLSFDYINDQWLILGSMLVATLILYFYTFQLPPEGNKQSMDSSIYLACIFVYGTSVALVLLLLGAIIFALYERKVPWWKHLTNFSIYAIMIYSSGMIFHLLGGQLGSLDNHRLFAYITALIVYFIANVLSIGIYYYMMFKSNLIDTIKGLLKESFIVYLCVLILSLVLTTLIVQDNLTGLALFMGISILLSHLFKKMFDMYQSIEQRANMDQRTGLFNHTYFENMLETEMQQSKTSGTVLSLAMIDIDDFKRYNDHFGHLMGDKLLGFLGHILKEESANADITASRYGGEEFALVMPNYDTQQAHIFINRLRKRINDTHFDGVEIFPHGCLSFSAGIALYQIDIHDKSQLVDQADQALYYAKKQGKNIVHIYGNFAPLEQEIDIAQDVRDIEQQLNLFVYKDINTFKHSKRVFRYAMDMSVILKLDASLRRQFVLGALIHDIGKLEIPWEILNKKEKLTPSEWETVKKHVIWGKKMALCNEKFKDLAPFIELHHERFDGTGYPNGFKQGEIPKLCRMLTIIDSFDAMTSERPYQTSKATEEAIAELRSCAGTQFDPQLTELFIAYIEDRQFDKIDSPDYGSDGDLSWNL